jgi:NADH:ubiquinone oxidoreductase subunit 5 (subunit L)/multisubunit Na+/H+ antiporter MnhA subunit
MGARRRLLFALIGHWWEEKPNSDAALKAFLTNVSATWG